MRAPSEAFGEYLGHLGNLLAARARLGVLTQEQEAAFAVRLNDQRKKCSPAEIDAMRVIGGLLAGLTARQKLRQIGPKIPGL